MALKLVSTSGKQVLSLTPGRPLLVGRSSLCDVPVEDPTVSRRHASLEVAAGGAVRVRDLGSLNGTFVNGSRVADQVAVPGDEVSFGRAAFRLSDERPEPALANEPEEAALDATILRQLPVSGRADIASLVSGEPLGASRLRIEGRSSEERSAQRLALMLDVAKELSGQADLDRLLEKAADLSFQVMDVDRVAVLLLVDSGELEPRVVHSRNGGAEPVRVPRALAQKVLSERVALLVENAPDDVRFDRRRAAGEPVQSALCAPFLGSQGAALGLIYLDNLKATHSFSDEDLEFFTSFSSITAIAIENSQLIGRLQRKAVALSNFQRYFAPELAEQIAAEQGEVGLGGAKRKVVVLFADIRGFTALAEKLSPDEIASQLNEFFTEMVEIVFEHGGALDKFIGDALMAIWGAPLARPDDADRAAWAAVAMQRAVERLNREWERQGRHRLEVGIGINQGEAFAGNIGSARRLEYTVIGDAVNTAALLCSRAGPGEILIAEPLCRALETVPDATPLASLPLKGKAHDVSVFRLEWTSEAASPTIA